MKINARSHWRRGDGILMGEDKVAIFGGSWLSLRFSTIEPVSATAALFSPPQSHT